MSNFPEDLGADFVDVHPHWTRPSDLQAYASRDLELGLWMFDIVPETLDAIDRLEPAYVTTSEARELSRWLADR